MQVPKAPALIIVREQGLMKENRTAELKRIARGKMLDKYGTAIGAYLLQAVIMGIVQYIALQVSDTTTVMGMIVYTLISLIIELIMVVFAVGELTIYFNISRGAEAKATDVFNGFKLHPDKAITVAVLVLVRSYVLLLPAIIAYVYFMLSGNNRALIVAIVAAVPGIIRAAYVLCELSQCYYILLDYPRLTASEIVSTSKDMMKGHIGEYFGMVCSFIPLFLVGILSLGFGMVLLYPYMRMTMTEFYLDLVRRPEKGANFDAVIDDEINCINN